VFEEGWKIILPVRDDVQVAFFGGLSQEKKNLEYFNFYILK
jgi:hypothetical protein